MASIATDDKARDTTPGASSHVNTTRMATITLGQDPNHHEESLRDNSDLTSPVQPSNKKKRHNAIKKKPAALLSEAKKAEQNKKELKQRQFKQLLDNVKKD